MGSALFGPGASKEQLVSFLLDSWNAFHKAEGNSISFEQFNNGWNYIVVFGSLDRDSPWVRVVLFGSVSEAKEVLSQGRYGKCSHIGPYHQSDGQNIGLLPFEYWLEVLTP